MDALNHVIHGTIGYVIDNKHYGFKTVALRTTHTVSVNLYINCFDVIGSYTYVTMNFYPSLPKLRWKFIQISTTSLQVCLEFIESSGVNKIADITLLVESFNVVTPGYQRFTVSTDSNGFKAYVNGFICYDSSLMVSSTITGVSINTLKPVSYIDYVLNQIQNVSQENPYFTFAGRFVKWDSVSLFSEALSDVVVASLNNTTYIDSMTTHYVFSANEMVDTSVLTPIVNLTIPSNTGHVYRNMKARKLALTSATASHVEGTHSAQLAIDGNSSTRWASNGDTNSPNGWISITLDDAHIVRRVKIIWENAYASTYKLQGSVDLSSDTWIDITGEVHNNNGGTDIVKVSSDVIIRRLRLYGISMATGYAMSIYEIEVYGYKTFPLNTTYPATTTVGILSHEGMIASASYQETFYAPERIFWLANRWWERWASNGDPAGDNGWLAIYFNATYMIKEITIIWEAAYASRYKIQMANWHEQSTNVPWEDVKTVTSDGGQDIISLGDGYIGTHIRIYGQEKATQYGYSIYSVTMKGFALDNPHEFWYTTSKTEVYPN